MSRTAYLFPDTNILLHSPSWSNLPWRDASELATFDKISLLICHPVVMEIDKHKYRPADRTGKRARSLYKLLRPLIEQEVDYHLVNDRSPQVTLAVVTDLQPKADFLDYDLVDNRILGCVQQHIDARDKDHIFFLTNDIAAVASAQQAAVPYLLAPDTWRLPPEVTNSQRQVTQLTEEIARLQRAEPAFDVRLLNECDQELDAIEYDCASPGPLTDDQVENLLDELKRGIPCGPGPLPRRRIPRANLGTRPSTAAALVNSALDHGFLDSMARAVSREPKAYEAWIRDCEGVLRNLHLAMQAQKPEGIFTFGAQNLGTRPASDALVTIKSLGPLRVSVPTEEDDEVDEWELQSGVSLPSPPQRQFELPFAGGPLLASSVSNPSNQRANRTPDAFYYRTRHRILPTDSIVLECEQWRHGTLEELFPFMLHIVSVEPEVRGAVSLTIEASNLSDGVHLTVPVRIRATAIPIADHATKLVRQLIESKENSG